jgi:hypothetical protein
MPQNMEDHVNARPLPDAMKPPKGVAPSLHAAAAAKPDGGDAAKAEGKEAGPAEVEGAEGRKEAAASAAAVDAYIKSEGGSGSAAVHTPHTSVKPDPDAPPAAAAGIKPDPDAASASAAAAGVKPDPDAPPAAAAIKPDPEADADASAVEAAAGAEAEVAAPEPAPARPCTYYFLCITKKATQAAQVRVREREREREVALLCVSLVRYTTEAEIISIYGCRPLNLGGWVCACACMREGVGEREFLSKQACRSTAACGLPSRTALLHS